MNHTIVQLQQRIAVLEQEIADLLTQSKAIKKKTKRMLDTLDHEDALQRIVDIHED